jgi:hypothetical protein
VSRATGPPTPPISFDADLWMPVLIHTVST